MKLRDCIKEEPGFQYVADQMELLSPLGRQALLEQPFVAQPQALEAAWSEVEQMVSTLRDAEKRTQMQTLRHVFMQLHDIGGSVRNLEGRVLLNEVELFEIKQFAHLSMEAARHAESLGLQELLQLPDLREVFQLLDPDGTGLPHFYIYDSYAPQLTPLRKELRAAQQQPDENASKIAELLAQQHEIEQRVIAELCDKLHPYAALLAEAMARLGHADLLNAKAQQALDWNLCRPRIAEKSTRFVQLVNPRLQQHNRNQGLPYQPVDIEIGQGLCLITGANMAGKTVLLKSVGVAQLMAQTGMYAPAAEAWIVPVEEVAFCIGDEQNEMNGLSSFASEITKISSTLQRARQQRMLVLIDEPARTTNPIEGKAIVQALAQMLQQCPGLALVTTHYPQLGVDCRRLRVKGFDEHRSDKALTPQNISHFIDYSLTEDLTDDVPHEALRIASILGCDAPMLELASQLLENGK